MTAAVNLDILISNSMGDEGFVRDIVAMSVTQAQEQIQALKSFCMDGISEDWVQTAHALKGTAATLGAEDMRRLCEHAQKSMLDSTAQARAAHVQSIENVYADVRQALSDQGYLQP